MAEVGVRPLAKRGGGLSREAAATQLATQGAMPSALARLYLCTPNQELTSEHWQTLTKHTIWLKVVSLMLKKSGFAKITLPKRIESN